MRTCQKSVDTFLGTFPWKYIRRSGKTFVAESGKGFGIFFLNDIFPYRVIILMYCRKFINLNMCHVELKAEARDRRGRGLCLWNQLICEKWLHIAKNNLFSTTFFLIFYVFFGKYTLTYLLTTEFVPLTCLCRYLHVQS